MSIYQSGNRGEKTVRWLNRLTINLFKILTIFFSIFKYLVT